MSQETSDKLMKARCRLLSKEPFYGHVAMSMVWIPSQMSWKGNEKSKTMGVRVVDGGIVQCIYYPPFVESLSIEELFGVIQHEVEHIVRCHCVRVGQRQPVAWNIAADFCVNGPKTKPRIGYTELNSNTVVLPLNGEICWIPEDWPKDGSAEIYYDRLEKLKISICSACGRMTKQQQGGGKGDKKKGKKDKGKASGDQPDDQSGAGQPGDQSGNEPGGDCQESKCPKCGQDDDNTYRYGQFSGRAIDDHSVWSQSDVSEDELRQIVKDIVDQAAEKSQGHIPGHLQEAIAALGKPVVKWRELLRHYLGNHVGNQRRTYSRRNRRYEQFGLPGISHHAAAKVTVIVDTSGSVGQKELEQFFAEIDAIAYRAKVNVLQWDHAFQGFASYRRGDWKNFKVQGRGGTDMQAPVEWIVENHQVSDVQVMLTDGYCNWADPKPFPMITVITTPESSTKGPGWGHEVRLGKD